MVLIGNLDNVNVILKGPPDRIIKESIRAISQGVHVLAPSCDIPFDTPLNHVKAMVIAAKGFVPKTNYL